MIFKDKLEQIGLPIALEFDRLFELALSKQQHEGDLLLLCTNGSYKADILEWNKNSTEKLSPYIIGPDKEGHSEQAHYKFINQYRQNYLAEILYVDYLKEHEYSEEKRQQITDLTEFEELTIQLEMLVYLKFWEADMSIKRLYQLVRILSGESYDWHFKISESSRDKQKTGASHEIIRKMIRDKVKKVSPVLYEAIKLAYKSQIRNSIAHSNYSFLGRTIHPNNYIKDVEGAEIQYLTFDEWIDMFHMTLVLHNEMIRFEHKLSDYYANLASQGEKLKVKIIEPAVTEHISEIAYISEQNRFIWAVNK
jgi:hypothetical protein